MESFSCETVIISGRDAAEEVKRWKPQRLLVVADPYFYENGTAERIARASGASQVRYFTEVLPDPTVELAARGTAVVREFSPDVVAALGGGSAMDLA